jgi:hypothetical protein
MKIQRPAPANAKHFIFHRELSTGGINQNTNPHSRVFVFSQTSESYILKKLFVFVTKDATIKFCGNIYPKIRP